MGILRQQYLLAQNLLFAVFGTPCHNEGQEDSRRLFRPRSRGGGKGCWLQSTGSGNLIPRVGNLDT